MHAIRRLRLPAMPSGAVDLKRREGQPRCSAQGLGLERRVEWKTAEPATPGSQKAWHIQTPDSVGKDYPTRNHAGSSGRQVTGLWSAGAERNRVGVDAAGAAG